MTPLAVLSIILAVAGSVMDIRERRIPNWLTVAALLVAVGVRAFGQESVGAGLAGAGIAFLVGLPLFVIHAIGAGDVKYLTAFGAILGTGRIGPALVLTSISGGVLALGWALAQRRARRLIGDTARLALYSISMGFLGSRRLLTDPPTEADAPRLPLGVAIATGCVLVWFL